MEFKVPVDGGQTMDKMILATLAIVMTLYKRNSQVDEAEWLGWPRGTSLALIWVAAYEAV